MTPTYQKFWNLARSSPQLAAMTWLQWLQHKPLGQVRLSMLHQLKVLVFATEAEIVNLTAKITEKNAVNRYFLLKRSGFPLKSLTRWVVTVLSQLDCCNQLDNHTWLWRWNLTRSSSRYTPNSCLQLSLMFPLLTSTVYGIIWTSYLIHGTILQLKRFPVLETGGF